MGCQKLQLQDYFRLIKPENNLIKYCGAGFTTDANNITRTFTYDNNGNQTGTSQVVDGETIATTTIYNAAGQVTSTIDPEGYTSSTLYNAL